ncbi:MULTISPECIES: nucleoside deaminase [unclassified Desulfovibrio]|uniref:nucleoside deaminase n=1 Tax=unclassified Desulfovibrio TaxID=2593640 RepID=UPI002FD9F0F8
MGKKRFMERAVELSRQSMAAGGGPFGAVIVRDGKIIGEGMNNVTPHNDPTAHAEVEAIRNACRALETFDLSGSVIFTSCEPCPMCLSAIWWARIEKIYFSNTREDAAAAGFDDAAIYGEISKQLDERTLPIEQLYCKDSSEIFRQWLCCEEKTRY